MIEAIFFDFNGVIIDDERLQMGAYQQVLRGYGVELTEAQYFGALGMDDRTFVRTALERADRFSEETMNAVLSEKALAHRKLIEDDLPLFPGIVTLIKATSRHFALGVVSMADESEVGYVMERARLQPCFLTFVTADEVNACKPAPDCYLLGLEKLNALQNSQGRPPVFAAQCLVVEDSPPGIQSGRAAGMRTLGVTNTVSESDLRAAGAEVVTPSLADWNSDAIRLVF